MRSAGGPMCWCTLFIGFFVLCNGQTTVESSTMTIGLGSSTTEEAPGTTGPKADCGPLSGFLFGTQLSITSCTDGFFEGSVCIVRCNEGFSGPSGAWSCTRSGWQNVRPASCSVNLCGSPFSLLNVAAVSQCSDFSQDGLCKVRCALGYEVRGGLNQTEFFLGCDGGAWVSRDGEYCVDVDACVDHPCDQDVSQCIDDKAPSLGYRCACMEGFSAKPGFEKFDGSGCGPTKAFVREGDLFLQAGTGLDFRFNAGTVERSLDGLVEQLDNNDRAVEALVQPGGRAYETLKRAEGLNEPGGQVFETGKLIDDLQVEGQIAQQSDRLSRVEDQLLGHIVPDGLIDQEVERSTAIEATSIERITDITETLIELESLVSGLGDEHRLTRLEADALDQLLKTESARARAAEQANADAIRELNQLVSLSDATLDQLNCATRPTVLAALAEVRAAIPDLIGDILHPIISATCEDNGLPYNNQTFRCVQPAAGLHPKFPASSCSALLQTEHGKEDGAYWLRFSDGLVRRTFCDQTRNGGGWAVLMKMGHGSTFKYSSSHWTNPSTLWEERLDQDFADAKFMAFNSGLYSEFKARWRDTRDGHSAEWVWDMDVDTPTTALALFQKRQVLSTEATDTPQFKTARGVFTYQLAQRNYGTNLCGGNKACVRWGFSWSDGAPTSNDAEGGIGMNMISYSAGDYMRCNCGTVAGARTTMQAIIYAR